MSRRILVTGASKGLGRATALYLAQREGAHLHLLARDEAALIALAAEIRGSGGHADVHVASVTDRPRLQEVAQACGPLDALVAAAGISGITPVDAACDDFFDQILATDLTGCWNTVRAFTPNLLEGNLLQPNPLQPKTTGSREPASGRIVLVSSVLGRFGVPGYGAYCAAKHGLLGLTKALALELLPKGIFVNAVAPGWVETDMAQTGIRAMAAGMGVSEAEARRAAESVVPVNRFFRPEEIAAGIAWLLDPANTMQVGQCLNLDGGVVQV